MADGENPFIKLYKILRWFVLVAAIIAAFLAFKSPSNPGPQIDHAAQREQAQSFEDKISSLESAHQQGSEAEISLESGEVNAVLAQSLASPEARTRVKANLAPVLASVENKTANSAKSDNSADGQIKDARVEFFSDVLTGYFTTQAYGKEVHLTVSGKLGCKNGYATFEPTAFKIGDLSVPVSFVNPALQKKLAEPETREKLKLPDFVADLRIVNGRLFVVER